MEIYLRRGLKDSDYRYDESELDFEFYDKHCHHRSDTIMAIYVPIKKLT